MRSIPASMIVVSLLALAACGEDQTAVPGADPGTLPPVTNGRLTIDDIEIDPDAPPSGGLFGNRGGDASGDGGSTAAMPEDGLPQDDDVIPPPDAYDLPDDGDVYCSTEVDCRPVETDPPVVRLPEHEAFCALLDEIEERPAPEDDDEAMVVSQAWLVELSPLAPDEIRASYDIVLEVVDVIVQSGSVDFDEEALLALGPERAEAMEAAVDEVGEFIDTSC